jgi:hypothetical protein
MDILSIYSQFLGMHPEKMGRNVEHSDGMEIAKKHNDLTSKIAELKIEVFTVDAKGNPVIRSGLEEAKAEIAELEAKRRRLEEIADEYGRILESIGVSNPTHPLDGDPHHRKSELESVAKSAPNKCWAEFNRLHTRNHDVLPFDLAKNPDYLKIEEAQRIRMNKAKAELEPLKTAIKRLNGLAIEVKDP